MDEWVVTHFINGFKNFRKRQERLKRLVFSISRDMEVSVTFISLIFQTFWCIVRGIIKTTITILNFFSITKSLSLYRCSYLYVSFSTFAGNRRVGPMVVIVWWALISSGTIQYTKEKNVIILKLPAHTTNLLQPLDVSVFKSLKDNSIGVAFYLIAWWKWKYLVFQSQSSQLCYPVKKYGKSRFLKRTFKMDFANVI